MCRFRALTLAIVLLRRLIQVVASRMIKNTKKNAEKCLYLFLPNFLFCVFDKHAFPAHPASSSQAAIGSYAEV